MSPNLKEASQLKTEGGSDVFTSTRHCNTNNNDTSFKLNFWSNDDSPLIRPLLKTEPYSAHRVETSKGINTHQMDGYGGIACERITRISGRSGGQWLAGYALIILSGSAVFAMLIKFKDNKRSK